MNLCFISKRLIHPRKPFFKTYLQCVFQKHFQDVFARPLQDVFKTSSIRLQDMFARRFLQDAFKTSCNYVFKKASSNYVLKTSWRRLGRQKNVTLKASSPRRVFAWMLDKKFNQDLATYFFKQKIDSSEIGFFSFWII